jgi:hypothetical protein
MTLSGPPSTSALRRRFVTARRSARLLASTAVALILGAPSLAVGQQVGPYAPLGIRAGSFLIFPSLGVSETYNDNVFANPHNTKDDYITLLHPLVQVQSNFSRHSLNLTAGGNIGLYANHPDEDYQDAFIQSNGRLDVTRDNYVDGALNFGRAHEGRDDPENNPNQKHVPEIYQYGSSLSYTHLFSRLNVQATGTFARADYGPNQDSDRDQNSYTGELRTGFFVSPSINTYIFGNYNVVNRDQKVDSGGVERDTKSWGVGAGAAVELTHLITSDVRIGYTRQTYAEGSFNDNDGVGYALDLTWTPTQLTTVRATGGGNFVPTSSQGSDTQSNFRSTAGVSVDHELLRNVHLGAHVNYTRDDFSGPSRTDNGVVVGGGVTYDLNRNLSVDAGYSYQQRWSDLPDDEFSRNLISIGLTARL